MNLKLWRVVERFCRRGILDPLAFDAFAQLIEEDQETAIREKVISWNEEEREQLSLLISGTLDTVDDLENRGRVLQCQGLYITGSEASLRALGTCEIPHQARNKMAASASKSLPARARIIIGSRIVPVTWVHGFTWKQWRAGLARDPAMFSRPAKAQPKQAAESQAWILPVFVEKGDFQIDVVPDLAGTPVSELGLKLTKALARTLQRIAGPIPPDVSIHPILAAAHCCWANGKTIAVYNWAKAVQTRAQADGRNVVMEEHPCRGSVRIKDARTRKILSTLVADESFPVDGAGMAIQLLMGADLF